jgi:hypothetical protein
MTQPFEPHTGLGYTVREMFATVAYAALAIAARKAVGPLSVTWSWVVFGVVLIGGQAVVRASAEGALGEDPRRALPRVLLMMCVGGLFGFVLSFT